MSRDALSGEPAVVVHGLKRAYGERIVIDGLDLRIDRGEFVALLGESGCGKTTLLRALAGLDSVDGGHIDGPAQPAVVFQEHRLLPWFSLWRNVALGLEERDGRMAAQAALSEVGLGDRLDEPFAALDALTRIRMHDLVKKLVAKHRPGVLLVTHDVDEAIALSNRTLVMRGGVIVREYQVSRAANMHRSHPEAVALHDILLADLGVAATDTSVTTR
jgi:sulfonate transport system ATP-binding protein